MKKSKDWPYTINDAIEIDAEISAQHDLTIPYGVCRFRKMVIENLLAKEREKIKDRLLTYIGQRHQQHIENLELWNNGYLVPTAEDEMEIATVKEGLKGAIHELEEMRKFIEEE